MRVRYRINRLSIIKESSLPGNTIKGTCRKYKLDEKAIKKWKKAFSQYPLDDLLAMGRNFTLHRGFSSPNSNVHAELGLQHHEKMGLL